MVEVRTHDEALTAVAQALAQWASESVGALAQAAAAAAAAEQEAAAVVRALRNRVAALAQALASLPPEADPRPLQHQLDRAQRSLAAATDAAQRLAGVAARVGALERAHVRMVPGRADAGRADLGRRGADLQTYRAIGGGGGPGVAAAVPTAGPGGGAWMSARGLTDFDVAAADFSDNPIVGDFARDPGMSRADYRWAVQTWDEVVRPGLDRGMTRDDFAARDAQRGAPPLRRTADVHDMFLGDKPIVLNRRPDGSFEVNGGRHRIEVARELGISRLPARVRG